MEESLIGAFELISRDLEAAQEKKDLYEEILVNSQFFQAWRNKRESLSLAERMEKKLKARDKVLYEFFIEKKDLLIQNAILFFSIKIRDLPMKMQDFSERMPKNSASFPVKSEDFPPFTYVAKYANYEWNELNKKALENAIKWAMLAEFPPIPNMVLNVTVFRATDDTKQECSPTLGVTFELYF